MYRLCINVLFNGSFFISKACSVTCSLQPKLNRVSRLINNATFIYSAMTGTYPECFAARSSLSHCETVSTFWLEMII